MTAILILVAIVLFILAALEIAHPKRFSWLAWGLVFLTLWFAFGGEGLQAIFK